MNTDGHGFDPGEGESTTQVFSVSVFICVHLWLKLSIAFLRFGFEPRMDTKGHEFDALRQICYSCLFVFIRGLNFDPPILLTTDVHGWTRIRAMHAWIQNSNT
jgi:hypothetical protein